MQKQNHGMFKYLANFSWLLIIKIYRISINLFIMIWLARYLGPEQFGLFNYALSFVILFSIFSSLGIEHIFTKELLNNPDKEKELFGSSFILKIIGAFILLTISIVIIMLYKPNNSVLLYMVTVFAISYLFKAFEIIKFWFEANVKSKNSSIIEAIAITVSVVVKIYMIENEFSVEIFAWSVLIESLFLSIGLILIYINSNNNILLWSPTLNKMKYIIKEAWPLMIAGALYTIYTKIDQIMLGDIIGNEAVGLYVAAVNISQGWLFIPIIIATTFYPAMINAKKANEKSYYTITQHLLNLLSFLGLCVAVIMIFMSDIIISFTFGDKYIGSALILTLHIWGGIFVAMSAISYRYFISEGLQKTSLYRGIVGLVVNIILNYLLIPIYGAIGAAIATVVSVILSLYLFNITNIKTRKMFYMQTKALYIVNIIQTFKYIKKLRDNK